MVPQAKFPVLKKEFSNRSELVAYVAALSPAAAGAPSPLFEGGATAALTRLAAIDPLHYGSTRNYHDGRITRLSPYLAHGIIDLHTVRRAALDHASQPEQIIKFIQELAWRDFWQHVLAHHPEWAWQDAEEYKTGWQPADYADTLPDDIVSGRTGVAVIDAFVRELIETGYLHNHARMYLASYIVHFRRIKWQAGTQWFLCHLLDGDVASNNLSWQWIASTFSAKPYIFNLENVTKFFAGAVDVSPGVNSVLDASYEELHQRLFPNIRRNGETP